MNFVLGLLSLGNFNRDFDFIVLLVVQLVLAHVVPFDTIVLVRCSALPLDDHATVAATRQVLAFAILRPVDTAVVVRCEGVISRVHSHLVNKAIVIFGLYQVEASIFGRQWWI